MPETTLLFRLQWYKKTFPNSSKWGKMLTLKEMAVNIQGSTNSKNLYYAEKYTNVFV